MSATRNRPRPGLQWLGLLVLGLPLSACTQKEGEPVLGTVFKVEGTALLDETTASNRSRSLSASDKFSARDEIRVAAESSAALCLTPGIYLRCLGPARLRIEDLRVSKDGDELGNAMKSRRAIIQLDEGRVHVSLPRAGTAPCELKINTAAGTISANAGSIFSVTLKGESIRVLCLRGELTWSNAPAFSTPILPGYYRDRKPGDKTAIDPLPASENADAQSEVIAALDSAQYLEELDTAARQAPAPWRKK